MRNNWLRGFTLPASGGALTLRRARASCPGYALNTLLHVRLLQATHDAALAPLLRRAVTQLVGSIDTVFRRSDAEKLLRAVFAETGRLSTITEHTDFARFIGSEPTHAGRLFQVYREQCNEGNDIAGDLFQSEFGRRWLDRHGCVLFNDCVYSSDDITLCQFCDEDMLESESARVFTSGDLNDSVQACCDCANNTDHVYRCEISGYLFSDSDTNRQRLDTGETFCEEYCREENNLVEFDEDDDEYVRVGTSTRLCGYHGSERPWKERSFKIPSAAVGVELELGFAGGERARSKFLEAFTSTRTGRIVDHPFGCERDGSLESVPGGMEIISDPLSFREGYQSETSEWRWLLKTLAEYGAEGWKWRALAGIHVNQDVQHVSRECVLKYAIFISNAAALSKFVSGRKKIYGHSDDSESTLRTRQYSGGYTKKVARTYGRLTTAEAIHSVFSQGKYAPVLLRPDGLSMETRIFGSNIKYEGFMACVEYCVAVLEFVQTLSAQDVFSPTISAEFRQWLGPLTRKFPNLCSKLGIVPRIGLVTSPSSAKIIPLRAVA